MTVRAALASAASALLLAACAAPDRAAPGAASGSGSSADVLPVDSVASGRPDSTDPDTTADEAPFEGTTARVEIGGVDGAPGGSELLDVRTARHDAFDRIVFEYVGTGRPAVYAGYEASHVACGSGDAVAVEGAATLVVSMRPARAHTEAGEATVSRLPETPRLPSVRALRMTCDFEADVTWAVGVAARRPYRITTLASPTRVVVDVQH